MPVPDWIEATNKLGTLGIALVSATYAYLQYRRSQRWKSGDLAAGMMEKLTSDPQISLACNALDWGVGPLIIPEKYRELFRSADEAFVPGTIQHDPAVLCSAMQPYLNEATLKDPRGLIYRYCFITFFEHLDQIASMLKKKQIQIEDIDSLRYWLKNLCKYPYAPAGMNPKLVFAPALELWGYQKVFWLAEQLGVVGWSREQASGN